MTGRERDRFDQLAPRDLAITLRSLRRRLGPVGERAAAPGLADVIDRAGPTDQRLDDLLAEAARGAAVVANALGTSLTTSDPVIPAAVLDPSERSYVDARPVDIDISIASISDEADQAAQQVEHATAGELARAVAVAGGESTTPMAIGQQLARELIGALVASERHLDWIEDLV